jgi:glycosyltransferase involved in cell wall biosynthesis
MRILQVSTADIVGGAESVARRLFEGYRLLGHESWLAVGLKRTADPNVLLIPNDTPRNIWFQLCMKVARTLEPWAERTKGARGLHKLFENLSKPLHWAQRELGYEDFEFSGSWRLLDLVPQRPDVVHCHNLHGPYVPGGGYFDLRLLPMLSCKVPAILTLHDAWLLSGHCAHSFHCERWKRGCGKCPDLSIYPAIKRDSTAYNWRKKKEIYAKTKFFVATPSRSLMEKVQQSMLASAAVETRVIPNGVDLSIFHPADKQRVRRKLKINSDVNVLLFAANVIRQNPYKDYQTMREAVARVSERMHGKDLLFIALGENATPERIGRAHVQFVPYQNKPEAVAQYYQAADIYVHAAKVDTFPNTVLESLACGTPVVATAVGGIPEQVKGLKVLGCKFQVAGRQLNGYESDQATGLLVRPGVPVEMARAIEALLRDDSQRLRLGENARTDARERFDLNHQVKAYLDWYQEIIEVGMWNIDPLNQSTYSGTTM